ncbi:MAG TPA: hypothetical protein PKC49_07365 [Phycisphaerae bacterium]|nr:hypothetical protein [Phycisphaerae bacterium]
MAADFARKDQQRCPWINMNAFDTHGDVRRSLPASAGRRGR